uniref:Uncharacterized protein n=1 Tax=Aegilops tauschii subsp. strangulata TaxID=200361 RepID=A0A453GTC4_AEGTS
MLFHLSAGADATWPRKKNLVPLSMLWSGREGDAWIGCICLFNAFAVSEAMMPSCSI